MASIEKLHVLRFRNLNDQYLEPNKKINLFIGENGQGKTNLIESIYYLSHNRSFKTKNTKELIPFNEGFIQISALVDSLKVVLKKSKTTSSILIDDKKIATNSKLTQHLPIQIISPDRGFIVGGTPKLKRSYLDWGVYHEKTDISKIYRDYNKGLKNINSLLSKNIGALEEWFAQIAPLSVEISIARKEYINKLLKILDSDYFKKLSGLLDLDNRFELKLQSGWTKDLDGLEKEKVYNHLVNNKALFIKIKYLSHGPHKASIDFSLNKQDEVFLSRGEQKTSSIVFWILQVLILVEQNNSPIILIDDISSELDQKKINRLIDFFIGLDVQIFITDIGNTLISIDDKNATTFEINNGHITRKTY